MLLRAVLQRRAVDGDGESVVALALGHDCLFWVHLAPVINQDRSYRGRVWEATVPLDDNHENDEMQAEYTYT